MSTDNKNVTVWIDDSSENSLTLVETDSSIQNTTSVETESDPISPMTKLNTLVNNYNDGTNSYIRLRVKVRTTDTKGEQELKYRPGGTPVPPIYFQSKREGGVKYEGILGAKLVISRANLCQNIFEEMEKNPIVFIISPPFTGKTSIGQLLEIYLNDKFKDEKGLHHVRRISYNWIHTNYTSNTFEDVWKINTGLTFYEWLRVSMKQPVYLIMDEVQAIYNTNLDFLKIFWSNLKYNMRGDIHILILASYGEREGIANTSLVLNDARVLSSNILYFSLEEYNQLLDLFTKHYFKLPEEIRDYLWSNSVGHVGVISRTLYGVIEKFSSSGSSTLHVDFAALFQYLMSGEYSNYLRKARGSPSCSTFSAGERNILDIVTEKGFYKENHTSNIPLENLVKDGFLIRSKKDIESFIFPSPLFRRCYLVYTYGKLAPISDIKIETGKTGLKSLISHAIKYFRPQALSSKFSARSSSLPNQIVQPIESVWQMELYCACTNLLGTNVIPSAGGRNGSEGRIDIYVEPPYKWGIELLSEGKGTDEHLNRFKIFKNNTTSISGNNARHVGVYVPLLGTMIEEWIVIDFSSEMLYQNSPPKIDNPNLCIITYSTDFKTYNIHYQGGEVNQIILK
ncbi:hypothetical protein DLAC_10071 [Tieghemostelium lacteum]|uniref:Crinkler family protein n=1 Tax=Tieghemostelium lacteum TaxID=361077 RepID=A0A151Z628_TIELA|nr:hypothetical protein DLAC_10071 [Tieghemostelium lacteum]|eukprot:KYQ89411.1 hypothetical protein DLAC_10071 [Tieghemostelium lacteum]